MKSTRNRRKDSGTVGSAEDKWKWPTREELRNSWINHLADEGDKEKLGWIDELLDRSFRVLGKRDAAAVSTESSHWFQRGSAGASAGVATLTGGTLIGSVHGITAYIIGIAAAVVVWSPLG